MSTDLTFLTNEAGNKLKDRLDVLLKDDTRFFDCLVGYFYITGFFKLFNALKETEKIRILVGISTNKQTYDLLQTARQTEFDLSSHSETKKLLPSAILAEMEKSEDSSEIEQGVLKFIEWLKTGKLEVRAYPSEKIHAKLYIMTFAEDDRDLGRVITGSSNLTQAGLQDNIEFNVELKNSADYKFALKQFNDLWKHSVDVSEVYVDTIQKKSPYAQFSPYELYLKFLYEYFRGELNRPEELEGLYLPTGFKKLKYQEEAVLSAKRVPDLPALLTYFRQGWLDKFFVTADKQKVVCEIDFMTAAKILKPEDKKEKRQVVSPEFYNSLNRNKQAFIIATSEEQLEKTPAKGRSNEAYLLKRLKANEIRRCQTYTEDDEEFIRQITRLIDEGSMPKQTAKTIAQSIKTEVDPLKVLAHLRKNVPKECSDGISSQWSCRQRCLFGSSSRSNSFFIDNQ